MPFRYPKKLPCFFLVGILVSLYSQMKTLQTISLQQQTTFARSGNAHEPPQPGRSQQPRILEKIVATTHSQKREHTTQRSLPTTTDSVPGTTKGGMPEADKPKEHKARESVKVMSTDKPVRRWAYAFLIGGCSEGTSEYRGFLYNVMVAAQRLKEMGSQADIVLFIQMSYWSSELSLPEKEEAVLKQLGIQFRYLPKFSEPVHETFYALVMEKFRILQLVEYSRVLFLDSDIIPTCSMDYLFDLSEPSHGKAKLYDNVVLGWRKEPANAGCFMMRPDLNAYDRLLNVIRHKEEKALRLPWPHWDELEGWGHIIETSDHWRSPDGHEGTNWTWHASFADQGLLYHWTKYEQQQVSFLYGHQVEHWGSKDGVAVLKEVVSSDFLNAHSCSSDFPSFSGNTSSFLYDAPFRDFYHFTGTSKPWDPSQIDSMRGVISTANISFDNRKLEQAQAIQLWFQTLHKIRRELRFDLDWTFVSPQDGKSRKPPVGRFSDYSQMYEHIRAKKKSNWTAYEDVSKCMEVIVKRKRLRVCRT